MELHFKEADMFLLGLLMLLLYSSHIDGLSLRDPSIASNDKFGVYLYGIVFVYIVHHLSIKLVIYFLRLYRHGR